jgi:hypothetical protein
MREPRTARQVHNLKVTGSNPAPACTEPGSTRPGTIKPRGYDAARHGHLLGHGVRFGATTDVMAAGEGIETMLSVRSALLYLPMVAALPPTTSPSYSSASRCSDNAAADDFAVSA